MNSAFFGENIFLPVCLCPEKIGKTAGHIERTLYRTGTFGRRSKPTSWVTTTVVILSHRDLLRFPPVQRKSLVPPALISESC